MMAIVSKHFKFNFIVYSRDELLQQYKKALIAENEWNGFDYSKTSDSHKELIAKALRCAIRNVFTPELSPVKATTNPDLVTKPSAHSAMEGMVNIQGAAVVSFDDVVRTLRWGTYGKDGKDPLEYVRLIDCSTEHLNAILNGSQRISELYSKVIKTILESRK